ncbi:hypothetical protein KC976_01460, partial [Candidatus Saccharibacteria bacterium]|nr:hypothetical protein [Candidatus Saccharibacteria bacterium]
TADLLQFQSSAGAAFSGVNTAGNWYYANSGFTSTMQTATLTANRTITLPDATGTVITTGNLSSITATGTITSGAWNGSTVGIAYGGTGNTAYTTNGVNFYDGTKIASTAAGTTGQCLVGTTGSAPTWQSCSTAAGTPTTLAGDVTGALGSNTVSKLQGTTLTTSAVASGNFLMYNGSAWINQSLSGDITITGAGVATIGNGTVTNAKLANSSLTVTAGTGLTGGGSVSLGGSTSLSVSYGSSAGTAVQGNTTLTCPTGTGNLSGGGTLITLGTGGTCGSLTVVSSPSFISGVFSGASSLTLGTASTNSGSILFQNAANANVLTLTTAAQTGNYALTIPTLSANADICTSLGNCATASGSNYYIQNQNSSAQTGNYWITGTARADTAVITPAIRPTADGTTAFQIQNAAGTQTMLNVDTTNLAVSLANVATAQQLSVNDWRTGSTLSGKSKDSWQSITSSADGTKLAAVVDGGSIYTSADSGATWTERTSAGSRNWASIASSTDGTKLAAVVDGGYIYTSADSGATWTERTSAGSRNWYSITSSTDGTKLAAGVNGGKIYTLYNGPQLTVTGNGAYSGNLGVAGALQASAAVTDSLFVTGTTVLQGLTQVNLSADTGTNLICQNSNNQLSVCDSSVQAPTAANFILNQNSAVQTTSRFWISGDGRSDTSFTTPLLQSAAGTALTVDSGTTGALNIGTSANAKTLTIGNTTGATAVNLVAGTGNVNITGTLVTGSQSADPTGVAGAMYYNSTTNTFRCYQAGTWQNCMGALYTTAADSTALNGGTTGAQFFSTAYSMPANYCTQGRAIHLSVGGVTTSTTTAQAMRFAVYVGGTQIGQAAATYTPTASQTNAAWFMDYTFTCRAAPSAASAIYGQGTVATQLTPTTAAVTNHIVPSNFAGVNVATNAAANIQIAVTYTGTANAANTVTLKQLVINSY